MQEGSAPINRKMYIYIFSLVLFLGDKKIQNTRAKQKLLDCYTFSVSVDFRKLNVVSVQGLLAGKLILRFSVPQTERKVDFYIYTYIFLSFS